MPTPIPAPAASGATRTTEVPLHWAAYGPADAPPILVLHGGPGAHHDYMLPQMLRLAGSYRLVFYDQRGGGRSPAADRSPITWRTHVDDLARVAAELGLQPLSLLGYSWGGLLALLYAAEQAAAGRELPARMALIAPAPITHALRQDFEREMSRRQRSEPVARMRADLAASGLRERDPAAYRQRLFELGVAGYFADPARSSDLTPFRITGRVQQSVWESLGDYDLRSALARITTPTLIAHGRLDPIPLASSELLVHTLPDARLVVLEGSGHVPYVEAADALFAALEDFLSATAPLAPAPPRGPGE